MRRLWAVLKREYLERVRNKWFTIATVFGPIFFGTLFFLPVFLASRETPSADVARIAILDATGTELGREVANELNGGLFGDTSLTVVRTIDVADIPQAEQRATREVRAGQFKGYLVLGRGVLAGGGARYAGLNVTSIADMRRLEQVVQRQTLAELLRRAGADPDVASRFGRNSSSLHAERISTSGRGASGNVNIIFAMVVSLLLYTTILMYGQTMLRGVIEEKQTRVAEVVVSSIRPTTLLAGKVLGVGAVGLTQMLIWLACSWVMLHYRVAVLTAFGKNATPLPLPSITAPMLALLLLFFLLGYLLYSTLFAMVGAMVSSETEAQQAQLPVVLLLVASIIFLMPVLNSPDGRLAVTLGMLPVTSPIVMPLRMSAVDVPPWEVVLSLFALVAGCYLGVYVAARVYRTGLLLYGKRATVREIARWVRESR